MSNQSEDQEQQDKLDSVPHPDDLDRDESSVSTTATDTPSVQSTPTPKSPKHKKKHNKKSSSKKSKKSPGLTEAEQDLYNTHADQIRQNAMQLLNTEVSPSSNRYRSYHDQPSATTTSSEPQTMGNLPPWSSTNSAQSSYGVGDSLSMTQVASMAFNCIAHCLTEGYRAASNYYSETTEGAGTGYNHNYAKVGGESNHHGEISTGYQDGYQQHQRMDRGLNSTVSNQSSGQGSTEQTLHVKGEYATVSMPSTYQGGSK